MNLGIFFYYPIILGEKDLLSAAWEPPQLSEGELDMPSPYGERVGTRDSVMSAAWEPPQLDERSRYLRRGRFNELFHRAKL